MILSLYAALCLFSACADKEDLEDMNYITANIQGTSWADREVLKGTSTNSGISCGGANGAYTLGFLIPKNAAVGSTTITTGSASLSVNPNELKQFTTTNAELTLSGKTASRVDGTFQMVLTHSLTGETLKVTDGKFSVAY